jgi:hypothetical protein
MHNVSRPRHPGNRNRYFQVQSEDSATAPIFMATDQDDDEKKSIAGSRIDLPDFDGAS